MYEAFDSFIDMDTWHTRHSSDLQRFYKALDKVVHIDGFDPDKMAEYFRLKLNLSTDDYDSDFGRGVDLYTADAWAVKDFIKYTGSFKK